MTSTDPSRPARTRHVALATCRRVPGLHGDDRPLIALLAGRGLDVSVTAWDDPSIEWAAFDLVVIRNTWDYTRRRDEFVAWASTVPRLANPADVVAWNTDKRYLVDVAAAGVPTVPTVFVEEAGQVDAAFAATPDRQVVVKPAVGAGAVGAASFHLANPVSRAAGRRHIDALLGSGHPVMVQPFIDGVERLGETAVVFVGGVHSHAVRKAAMLPTVDAGAAEPVGRPPDDALYLPEWITARRASRDELDVAVAALDAVPGGPARLLYARVDLLTGSDGQPMVLEVELTEPTLFLAFAPGAAGALADAVVEMTSRPGVWRQPNSRP